MEWIKANRIFTYHAKEFNLWLIGEGWKKGFHFEEGQMIQEEDSGSTKGRRVIETPTEEDVFSALGIPWIEPRDRIGPPKGLQKHDDD